MYLVIDDIKLLITSKHKSISSELILSESIIYTAEPNTH